MRLFGFFRLPRLRVKRAGWMRIPLIILGLVCFGLAVWFGGPMTGIDFFAKVWVRVTVISVVVGIFVLVWLIRWRRRRKAAKELEETLIPAEPVGDAKELGERMTEALATLKKSGGKAYLYDLPWYVIIGPPGAGKTTALANSGIEFPLAGGTEGFGGTRYCDWWFAEDAILIDTAGRYTTQDSNAEADEASWTSFLELLKKGRPKQPINGVILAFSVEDMMTAGDAQIAAHAATVRKRLAEIHEALKIDFPVYVLFTKADLISGFREYFSSFSLNRRNSVWGVTFQTKDRKALTHEAVPAEFDKLVSRLSDEVIDRLSEEQDPEARIAIFGLPGQMASLRDGISDFLRRVFEPTRYKTNAILRGFYFTSGTQEGTPIDQILGAMSRVGEQSIEFQPSFMSGQGKSYFLHDLLKRVIFAERDWVSHDKKAVRRSMIWRSIAASIIGLVTVGLLGAFGYSYWQNASLVKSAAAEAARYERAAVDEIKRDYIDDPDLRPVLPYLETLRAMPAGYGDSEDGTLWEGFGLGQRSRLQTAAQDAYSGALERMLRPRLILDLERRMPAIIQSGQTTDIYRALKVYMLLGGQGEHTDDEAVKSWFDESWRKEFTGRSGIDIREQLSRHLDAMLELDDSRNPLVDIDTTTINAARNAIVQLPLVDQAYSLIMDRADTAGLPDWSLTERTGGNASLVFSTRDGADLSEVRVPAVFTYEGFWSYFYPQLDVVGERLKNDQWVLGETAQTVDFDAQLDRLDRVLMERYRRDFKAAWDKVFNNLTLNSMVADKPQYRVLSAAASASASPLLLLVKEVEAETRLTREFEGLEGLTPDALAGGGDAAGKVQSALTQRMRSRSSGVQRILFDAVSGNAGNKAQGRVTGGGGEDSITRPIERIEEEFTRWHALLEGEIGQRPIDAVLGNLGAIWTNLRLAESSPEQSAALQPTLLNNLTQYNSQLPVALASLINKADRDFRQGAADSNLTEMNRALTNRITFFCRENITNAYPFGSSARSLSISNFSRFFGPGGDMDRYFSEYLEPYVERTPEGLRYRADSPLAGRLSLRTLRQFERAEKIRQAFFAGGGTTPQVEISVAHVDGHNRIKSALLVINDMPVPTQKGDMPRTVVWPGTGKATVLQISPAHNRESKIEFRGSSWTFIDFLNAATSKTQRGDTLRATYTLGGRTITYDFTINAITNPFTMRELKEFECPQSLD